MNTTIGDMLSFVIATTRSFCVSLIRTMNAHIERAILLLTMLACVTPVIAQTPRYLTVAATKELSWVTVQLPIVNYTAMNSEFYNLVADRRLVLAFGPKENSIQPTDASKKAILYNQSELVPAGRSTVYKGIILTSTQRVRIDFRGDVRIALLPGEYWFDILFVNSQGGSLGGAFNFGEIGQFSGGKEYNLKPVFTNPPG